MPARKPLSITSYNGARAWKQLDFPEDAAPILSLALSPDFSHDQTIYAGTENQGLFRSADLGRTWQKLNLPATCVNALAISPEHGNLFAATDSGLYRFGDGGRSWNCLLETPDTLSMAIKDSIVIAGLADQGAWLASDTEEWHPFFTVPARSLVGMALSPGFDSDPVAFLYGPQEGIWRTADGGLSWECLNAGLPGLDVQALAISPGFPRDRTLVAASTDGILLSEDAGDHWLLSSDTAASSVSFSPNGKFVAAGFPEGEIRVSDALKGPWDNMPAPWEGGGKVLALAVDDNLQFRVALLDRAGESLGIWEGQPGRFERILSRPASAEPIVVFWVPPHNTSGGSWYAGLDGQVWEFRRPVGEASVHASPIFAAEDGSKILTLTGSQGQTGLILFACTGQTIYKSTAKESWTAVHHFGDERAISLVLSPSYPRDPAAYALLLGGSFCRSVLQ